MPRHPCHIAAFNLRRMYHFVNSVAYAQAAQNHTSLSWQPYRDSRVLNAIYFVLFWKGSPGTAEISQDTKLIEKRRAELMRQYWKRTLARLHQGPHALVNYLNSLEKVKQSSLESLRDLYRDAASINRDVVEGTQAGIEWLAGIKLASTVFLAVTPAGLTVAGASTAGAATVVATGASVIGVFAKDLASAKRSSVIAFDVGKAAGKAALEEKASKIAEHHAKKIESLAEARLASESKLIAEAEAEIGHLNREIARKVSSSKIAKLGRQVDRAELRQSSAQAGASAARRLGVFAHFAGKALPIVFAAHDVMEALEEYRSDVGEPGKPDKR